jgi:hypothetical protein
LRGSPAVRHATHPLPGIYKQVANQLKGRSARVMLTGRSWSGAAGRAGRPLTIMPQLPQIPARHESNCRKDPASGEFRSGR